MGTMLDQAEERVQLEPSSAFLDYRNASIGDLERKRDRWKGFLRGKPDNPEKAQADLAAIEKELAFRARSQEWLGAVSRCSHCLPPPP